MAKDNTVKAEEIKARVAEISAMAEGDGRAKRLRRNVVSSSVRAIAENRADDVQALAAAILPLIPAPTKRAKPASE